MIHDESALELVREALLITLKVCGPLLLAGVVVGLVISIVQAITSIQDQALTFVPKIVVMVLLAVVLIPWIAARLIQFAAAMFTLT